MRNILIVAIITLVVIVCFRPSVSFADMIYLKNGKQVEGVVIAEDDTTVTVNIGFGKVTFQRKNISRIVKYAHQKQVELKKELGYKYFGQPEFIPKDLKEMINHLKEIEELKGSATDAKNEKNKINEKIAELESKIDKSNKELAKVSKKLSTSRIEGSPEEYNALIKRFYSLEGEIKMSEYERDELKKETPLLDAKIAKYVAELNGFRKKFAKEYSKQAEGEQKRILDIIQKKIEAMGVDFTKYTVAYDFSGSNIVVKTLLNELVPANLILDTGASVVVISKNIANKLNLSPDDKNTQAYVTLADGRQVKANMAFLESIQVGKLEAKNIRTAVLEHEEAASGDGLLGMSFLKNFMLKIDPSGKQLILEEFNP